jgi:hypothetical protein
LNTEFFPHPCASSPIQATIFFGFSSAFADFLCTNQSNANFYYVKKTVYVVSCNLFCFLHLIYTRDHSTLVNKDLPYSLATTTLCSCIIINLTFLLWISVSRFSAGGLLSHSVKTPFQKVHPTCTSTYSVWHV